MTNTTSNNTTSITPRNSLLNKNIVNEAPDLSLITDDFTSATIEKPIPELNNLNWTTGIQLCDKNRQPYSREFSELSFDSNTPSSLEKIELGAYVEQYEGTFYYSVTTEFNERTYKSSRNIIDRSQDFLKWQTEIVSYRHELVYTHKLIKQITWTRPLAPASTGIGNGSDSSDSSLDGNNSAPRRYIDLPTEYIIGIIDSNKALAAEINCSHPIEITLLTLPSDTTGEIVSDLFLLRKRYIKIKLKNVINGIVGVGSHSSLTISFYGKYKYQVFYPKDLNKNSSYLLHRNSSTLSQRLQPPGKTFNDNFWNSNPPPPPIDQYSVRKENSPSISNSDTLTGSAWSENEIEDETLNPQSSGMSRSVYDSNRSGIVDNSERLGSNPPSYYLDLSNSTGQLNISNLTTTEGTTGDYLKWNGSNWIPQSISLNDLSNININPTSVDRNKSLVWDGTQFILTEPTNLNYMLRSTYDSTNTGVVDNSEKLNGNLPSFYLNRSNHTGTLNISFLTTNSQNPLDIGKFLAWNGTSFVLESSTENSSTSHLMPKSIYDSNNNGIVDNSELLNNQPASYYLNRSNHTGSLDIVNLTSNNAAIGSSIKWDGTNWSSYRFKLTDLVDVNIPSFPNNSNSYLSWDHTNNQFILKEVIINGGSGTNGHIIRYNNSNFPSRENLEFIGELVTVNDNSSNNKTIVTIDLPSTVVLKNQIDSNGNGIIDLAEVAQVANSVNWANVQSKPFIPINLNDLSDVTLTTQPDNNDIGKALIWNGTQFILGVPIDEKPGHQIFNNSVAVSPRLKVNFRGGVEISDDPVNQWTDILITGMSKDIYDPDNDGSVVLADKIKSSDTAPNTSYYGKNGSGVVGFHSLPGSETYLTKTIYDTNNTGIVDDSERLNNQLASYYLNRENHTGQLNINNLTTTQGNSGDYLKWNGSSFVLEEFITSNLMNRNTYDTNNNGIVDNSERLGGNLPSYYLNVANQIGFLDVNKLTTSNGFAGNLLRWDGSNWGAYPVKIIDLFDVSIPSVPAEDNYYLTWDTTLDKFILKTITLSNNLTKHTIRYNAVNLPDRGVLEFTGGLVNVIDNSSLDRTIVNFSLPNNVVLENDIGYQSDGSVAIARIANQVNWIDVTSKPNIPSKLDDLSDVVINSTPTAADTGKALVWTGTTFTIGIPLDQKPSPDLLYELNTTVLRPRINFTGAGVELIDNPANNAIDIRITGLSNESMAKSIYDSNNNGVVDLAENLNGITSAANSTYYGKNSLGDIGFHTFNTTDFLTKAVYASSNNLDSVNNSDKLGYQLPSYYLNRSNHSGNQSLSTLSQSLATTNQSIRWSGSNWVPFTPSDMYKSTYDTNNSGVVDVAESILGISGADNYTYYGKNSLGVIGFHPVPQTDGFGDMQRAVFDINSNGIVDDAEKLNGQSPSYYLNRTNHTGTQTAATINDFTSTTKTIIDSTIVSSSTISKNYSSGFLSLNTIDNTSNQKIQVINNGTFIGIRKALNFIPGSGVTLNITDSILSDRVDITIASSGGSGGTGLDSFNTYTKAQVVQAVTLTEASTINTDASLSNNFSVNLTGNRILANPTNLVAGGTYNWLISQDSVGSKSLTFGNLYILSAGSTLNTSANGRSILSCIFIGGFLYCSIAKF